MCALLGVIGKLPEKEVIIKARDMMTHRGPDDAGLYYSSQECVAFGHRRLSIIDLSPDGRQPFFSNDNRFVIIFNGEIYNYIELKKELKNFYEFKTQTDTEVLLAAYIRWGDKCLQKLNGMFSFAVWDREKEELFAARDRLGTKPFYYRLQGNSFYFASEIKGLLSLSDFPRELNKKGFLDFLNYRYVLGERTLFKDIFSLLPAHYLIYRKGALLKRRYWNLPFPQLRENFEENEVLEKTKKLLKSSIKLRLRSDVPVGAFLSGGLDSSLVVALMAEAGAKDLKTFSAGFEGDIQNELPHAKRIAKLFGTDHHDFVLTEKEYIETLPEAIRAKDTPLLSPNEVAWLLLSKKMKKEITVVLSGGGADELFGGYGRILRSGYDLERMLLLGEKGVLTDGDKKKLIDNLREKYKKTSFKDATLGFLAQYPYTQILRKNDFLNTDIFRTYLDDPLNSLFFENFFEPIKRLSPGDQYLRFFETIHLRGTMESLDSMTMAASLEGREPYLDVHLVEYVMSLPFDYKLRWRSEKDKEKARVLNSDQISEVHDSTKYLLRKVGSYYLPPDITERKKVGFPVPLQNWASRSMREYAQEMLLGQKSLSVSLYNKKALERLLSQEKISSSASRDIWTLLNMEIWTREYNVVI